MSSAPLTYALVTPARDEAGNLRRLAASVEAQTVHPVEWVIVDNGSADGTADVVLELAARLPWVRLVRSPGAVGAARGAPIVRAFMAGLESLESDPEIVVKLDADLSFPPEHFEGLLAAFAAEPRLGIAGGVCWEEVGGVWKPQFATRDHVRGAARAYRRACLDDVLPLAERMGWDGVDELKAQTRGWRIRSLPELPIRHHRALGGRERRLAKWVAQGDMAHFMGYRPSYLLCRALYRAAQEPSALAMVWGYARAALQRRPRYEDAATRAHLRREQSLLRLPERFREARGR